MLEHITLSGRQRFRMEAEEMRYPQFITEGDTIGFAAPAFGCATEPYRTAFDNSLGKWREIGFGTKLGPNCYADEGVGISSTPEKCAGELMEMMQDGDVSCVISCGGGELMCEIVPYMDFELLGKVPPKWFMGYSDNTNMTFLLTTLADTAAVYGPCAAAFGMEPWHPAVADACDLLQGKKLALHNYDRWERESLKDEEHPLEPYHVTEPFRLHSHRAEPGSTFGGRLLGGCLDCLSNLVGTRFDRVGEFAERYQDEGILWFLESCELNAMDIRRTLWNLREAGWFEGARGFLVGRPMLFGEPVMGLDQYEAVTGILGGLGVPILMDLDIGHTAPMMPLVSGAHGTVAVGDNNIEIKMELV